MAFDLPIVLPRNYALTGRIISSIVKSSLVLWKTIPRGSKLSAGEYLSTSCASYYTEVSNLSIDQESNLPCSQKLGKTSLNIHSKH